MRHWNVDVAFRFARDSSLEEGGFELPVPLSRKGLPGIGRVEPFKRQGAKVESRGPSCWWLAYIGVYSFIIPARRRRIRDWSSNPRRP